eukprot:01184.XXX_1079_1331_1 [CDS] Oithona nana genome sequencing.
MVKSILALLFLSLVISTCHGIECQQCGEKGTGLCLDFADNGENVTCRDGLDACWLYQISKNLYY